MADISQRTVNNGDAILFLSGRSDKEYCLVTTNRDYAHALAKRAWLNYRGPWSGPEPTSEPLQSQRYFSPRLVYPGGEFAILVDRTEQPTGLRFKRDRVLQNGNKGYDVINTDLMGNTLTEAILADPGPTVPHWSRLDPPL